MHKLAIITALLTISTLSVANTSVTEEATVYTSVRNFPVIVSNEKVTTDTCRLNFESGLSKEVPCTPALGTENVAFAPLPDVPMLGTASTTQ